MTIGGRGRARSDGQFQSLEPDDHPMFEDRRRNQPHPAAASIVRPQFGIEQERLAMEDGVGPQPLHDRPAMLALKGDRGGPGRTDATRQAEQIIDRVRPAQRLGAKVALPTPGPKTGKARVEDQPGRHERAMLDYQTLGVAALAVGEEAGEGKRRVDGRLQF